ncbi:MAG: hypothetical protein L0H59_11705 [Tomitella sp.]|nr:hypothetical protein [Tomitella sp.]
MALPGIGELKGSLNETNRTIEGMRSELVRTNDEKLDAVISALETTNKLIAQLVENTAPKS